MIPLPRPNGEGVVVVAPVLAPNAGCPKTGLAWEAPKTEVVGAVGWAPKTDAVGAPDVFCSDAARMAGIFCRVCWIVWSA